jgi:diguanylate cyclase (GGDEF)-like protein
MRIDRRVMFGGAGFLAFVLVVYAVMQMLTPESMPRIALSDAANPLLEIAVLALALAAVRKNANGEHRWTWIFLALWTGANLFADSTWAWYEVVLRSPLPSPSIADIGYLMSYPLGFLTVVFAIWKGSGRLRTIESALDALMITLGVAGLMWPLLLAPMLRDGPMSYSALVSLAYPLGDLLVFAAFASLLFSTLRERPPRFLMIIWLAFAFQLIADIVYFVGIASGTGYISGNWIDSMWALTWALSGIAALVNLYPSESQNAGAKPVGDWHGRYLRGLSYPRLVVPYLAVPVAGALIWLQFSRFGAVWNADMQVLVYVGISLVAVLVIRQLVAMLHNRSLYSGLSDLSHELSDRVHALAGMTRRLEELNTGAIHLNSLRALSEIMQGGLQLACSITKCPAAWVSLKDAEGNETVAAAFGPKDMLPAVGETPQTPSADEPRHIEQVTLEARGEKIGNLWLLRAADDDEGPDLVHAVGAQLATAIDNTRRYEEVLKLAERDPLTGLLNHRAIHQRLAIEGRRSQQQGGRLSVVMIDLDDFKLLNDTYGHPAGDRVLSQVSDTIRSVLRQSDLAGRVGGDEMMLVLPDTDRAGAVQLAERLREELRASPFVADKGREIPLRLSLGIATYPADADTLTGLVTVADASLYASKQKGGDTITEPGTPEEPAAEPPGLRGIAGRLMDVVGARDHYTRRHSDRVAVYAARLGEALGLEDNSLETLRLAAMLHDVGKLGLRPRVLRKPAPLTDDEERSVRQHIDYGESIIRDLPRVAEVLDAVHAHHERFDGTGYPAGLLGEDIPLLGRILAVADAYAAMTIDRPYRLKLSADQARVELLKVAGTQLDPELVGRFVQTLDKEPGKGHLAAAG